MATSTVQKRVPLLGQVGLVPRKKTTTTIGRALLLITFCLRGVMANGPVDREAVFLEKIKNVLPIGWIVAETNIGVIPSGHYWGLEYEGPKGVLFVLQGKKDVFLFWTDKDGMKHRESLAKESLELWIMPRNYKESWRRLFAVHRPKAASLLISGKTARVYTEAAHRITDDERFRNIVSEALSTDWPESPARTELLSWKTWRHDLRQALKGE